MAYTNRGSNLPGIVAGADLTGSQHHLVTIDSTGRAVLSGLGGRISAVVENNPNVGQAASLMGPGSVAKVVAGAAIAFGADIASDALGRAVPALLGDYVIGQCVISAGALGELCSVWILNEGDISGSLTNHTNLDRPDASTVSIGFAIFNTDDGAPNYSDGTAWRDALGNAT